MYTLLPDEQIKNLVKEYHIRLFILGLFCLSGAVWIGIGSLLPSYIISVMQQQNAQNHLQAIEKTTQTPVNASVAAEVAASNANILLIKGAEDTVVFSAIIEDLANRRIPGITLNDIEIAHAPVASNPNETSVAIRGTATTRDVLVAFQHALVGDTEFSQVDLPISDLAKSTDVDFSITLMGVH
jgi:hypothetical protein